jgi:hypothetical protein
MNARCSKPSNGDYAQYGGRGIRVCAEWQEFPVFAAWALANGYADHLSIDRENPDGNYAPTNCRWATTLQQGENKRSSRRLTYNGETLLIAEWARRTGIPRQTIRNRIERGDSPEECLRGPSC